MKEEQTFNVEKVGDEVVYTQTMKKTMSVDEAIIQHNGFKAEMRAVQQQKEQLQKMIDDDVQQKQLDSIKASMLLLEKVDADWSAINEPEIEKIVQDLRGAVKIAKAKHGYDRVKEVNAKIVLQNKILAEICVEKDLDMGNPAVRQVKKDFDTI